VDKRAAIARETDPKHGPHLNVSYRGEKGKTTGYYVPKGAQQATRQGVEAWQKNAATFARTGGVEQGPQFAACPRGRFTVKQWLGWALACWVVVYLLLSLGQQAARELRSAHPR